MGSFRSGTAALVTMPCLASCSQPSYPQVMVYVRAHGNAVVSGIRGSYQVYFKTGYSWSGSRRAFTSQCAFTKFEQSFFSRAIWRIGLQPTVFGNADTSDADPY